MYTAQHSSGMTHRTNTGYSVGVRVSVWMGMAVLCSLLSACAVVSVASATVSVAATAVSVTADAAGLATDAAIGTAKVAGKVAGKVVDAATD